MGRISRRQLTVVGAIVVLLVGALAIRLYIAVPSDAATVPVARAVLEAPVGSLPPGPTLPSLGMVSGGTCLPRISREGGWLDLCWEGYFWGRQSDGRTDYYLLRMYGSHQGWRWVSLRSQVIGGPEDGIFDVWPNGIYEGECRQEPVSLIVPMGNLTAEDVCGRTEGREDPSGWSAALTWTCQACLVPDDSMRAVSMYEVIGVPAGTVPSWDLFASGGS
ncbi:MAG: hypothetical protein QOI92_653 [Chloroflexota bacterium]|jgi:hypothetical protein|nr:hypothetical protein [Chloroflexota bacterium]